MILADYPALYVGNTAVVKMYRGAIEVWPNIGTPPGGGGQPATGDITLSATYLPDPTFPINVSTDGRGFVDATGAPFYGVGDTAWMMVSRLTQAQFTDYCTQRRSHGYTQLFMSILDIASLTRAGTASGQTPFQATGFSTDIRNPLTTGTYSYWDHLEWCVDEAASHGLHCVLIPMWYGYHGNMWRPFVASTASETVKAESYGTFLGNLLGNRTNVWWMLGGDNGPGTGTQVDSQQTGPRVDVTIPTNAMGQAIKTAQTVDQEMTYHTYRTDNASVYFGSESWYTMHAAYSGLDVPAEVIAEWNRSPVKPVVFVEGYYDARQETGLGTPHLTRVQLRGQAYQGMLGGATSFANGHEKVWSWDYRTGMTWQAGMDAVSANDQTILSRVFASFPSKHFRADHSNPLVTTNRNSGVNLAAGAISSDSTTGIIYVPTSRTFTVSLSQFTQLPQLAWIHPETGAVTQFDATGTSMSLTTPVGWSDAILAIEVHTTGGDPDPDPDPVEGSLQTLAEYSLTSAVVTTTGTGLTAGDITNSGITATYPTTTPSYGRTVLQMNPNSTTASSSSGYVEAALTPTSGSDEIKIERIQIKAARGGSSTPRGLLIIVVVDGIPTQVHSADVPTQRTTLTDIDITGLALQGADVRVRLHPYSPASGSTVEATDLIITGRVNTP